MVVSITNMVMGSCIPTSPLRGTIFGVYFIPDKLAGTSPSFYRVSVCPARPVNVMDSGLCFLTMLALGKGPVPPWWIPFRGMARSSMVRAPMRIFPGPTMFALAFIWCLLIRVAMFNATVTSPSILFTTSRPGSIGVPFSFGGRVARY